MGKAENIIETYFDACAKQRGGFTRKYVSPGRRGVPDRILFLDGVYFAELKTAEGILSVLQKREHERIRRQGVEVVVLASIEDVNTFFAGWDEDRIELDGDHP